MPYFKNILFQRLKRQAQKGYNFRAKAAQHKITSYVYSIVPFLSVFWMVEILFSDVFTHI